MVSTRSLRPVANWSCTKTIAQGSFDRVAGCRSSRSFAFTRRLGVWCAIEAQLAVDTTYLVLSMATTLTPHQHVNPISVAHANLADLSDPLFEVGLSGARRLVVVVGRVAQERTTGPADRNVPIVAHLIDQLALPEAFGGARPTASPYQC